MILITYLIFYFIALHNISFYCFAYFMQIMANAATAAATVNMPATYLGLHNMHSEVGMTDFLTGSVLSHY